MKRGRFDAEYDRVARRPTPKQQYDFPDDDEPGDQHAVAERVAAAHADFKERMAQLNAHEAERAALVKENADATTRRSNLIVMMQEYQQRGLTPPYTNSDGSPQFSLAFLLKMGWTIEMIGDRATLIKPARFR